MIDSKLKARALGALGEFHNEFPNYDIALATIAGSHSFGLATEKSDVDIVGAYIVPTMDIICDLDHSVEHVIKRKYDEYNAEIQLHEIKGFMGLTIQPNMNMMDAIFPYDYGLIVEKRDDYYSEMKKLADLALSKAAYPHIQGMTIHHRKHINKYNRYEPKRQLYIMREHMRGILLFEKKQIVNNMFQMTGWLPIYEKTINLLLDLKKKGEFLSEEQYEKVFEVEREMEQRMINAKEFGPLRAIPQENLGKLTKDFIKRVRVDYLKVNDDKGNNG